MTGGPEVSASREGRSNVNVTIKYNPPGGEGAGRVRSSPQEESSQHGGELVRRPGSRGGAVRLRNTKKAGEEGAGQSEPRERKLGHGGDRGRS